MVGLFHASGAFWARWCGCFHGLCLSQVHRFDNVQFGAGRGLFVLEHFQCCAFARLTASFGS